MCKRQAVPDDEQAENCRVDKSNEKTKPNLPNPNPHNTWYINQGQVSRSNAHFDTAQLNHVLWDTPKDLQTKLYHRILGTIGQGPYPPAAENQRQQTGIANVYPKECKRYLATNYVADPLDFGSYFKDNTTIKCWDTHPLPQPTKRCPTLHFKTKLRDHYSRGSPEHTQSISLLY